ncbi:MAG TPA: Ig-like domain-containing protein [Anaeromyxobacteraceae bacterium]|nr:Ig-like domain-containing protein [Anaeromyxobacteraceae bacterium]
MSHALRVARLGAAIGLALAAATPRAALLDHGPSDPVLSWPTWYRDLNGLAIQGCRSQTPSPNAAAGGAPMCFPLPPDPAGFAGNVGPEIFYNDLDVTIKAGAFSARVQNALEASYLSPTPQRGQEVVFARIRVVMTVQVPGTYKVVHPFGVEIFPDVQPGPRAVFFTADWAPAPGNFDLALDGRIGPFLQWDTVSPGETLSVVNGAGQTEQFLGDPNYPHTFTGSPFGTNYVRIEGPVGSNLDGVGNDFIQTPLANVLGQKYLLPIASPLRVLRSSYSRDPVRRLNMIDVFARSTPGAQLVLTGTDLPTVAMKGDAGGNFYAHLETPSTVPLPAGIAVTNVSDAPPTTVTAALTDVVTITSATFDGLTRALSVAATSSDATSPPPALAVQGPLGGPMSAGAYGTVLATAANPPLHVSVISAAGGSATAGLIVLPGAPFGVPNPPVAVPDAFTVAANSSLTGSVTANDSAPAGVAGIVVVAAPAHGTLAPSAAVPGDVTYTPAASSSGADSFQYVVQDATGGYSNVAMVNLDVTFVAQPPTANPDNWAQAQGTARTVNVLANDRAATGTTLDPATIAIAAPPAHGTATPHADGTITYQPAAGYVGLDAFGYTVSNNAGQASNVATESVTVSGSAETLSYSKTDFTVSKSSWNIVGSTNVFGAQLTQTTVTCWIGTGTTGTLIGSAPVDTTGKFAVVVVPGPVPPNPGTFTCRSSNGGQRSAPVNRR